MGAVSVIASADARNVVATNGSEVAVQGKAVGITAINGSCTAKWFSDAVRRVWGAKAAALVEHYTGAPERTCYRWVLGKTDISSDALRSLLRSDQGWIVLQWVMAGCKQKWWLEVVRARECSLAYEAKREQLSLPL